MYLVNRSLLSPWSLAPSLLTNLLLQYVASSVLFFDWILGGADTADGQVIITPQSDNTVRLLLRVIARNDDTALCWQTSWLSVHLFARPW